jgi:hypothetical protein
MTKHVSLRLENDLHSWLVSVAAREHRSVNGHIEWCLERERERDTLRGKVIHHKDGDRASLELDNLELRDAPKESER